MRSIIAALILFALSASTLAAQETRETQNERTTHALHGLMHMYGAGVVCFYRTWSFSRQDTDEMLQKIKELSKNVAKKTSDDMWTEVQVIMAEG
jgi:hypothetical protein